MLREVGRRARVELQRGELVRGYQAMAADTAQIPMPIRAGKDSTKVSVEVVWQLG